MSDKNPKYYDEAGALRPNYDRAVSYPNVTADDFQDSYMISVGKAEVEAEVDRAPRVIDQDSFSYKPTGELIYLQGAEIGIPSYDVTFSTEDGEEVTLRNRVSLAAIGSNSSPDILQKKFNALAVGDVPDDEKVAVMQAKLENHVVAEAAFVSGTGAVPVTIEHREDSHARITIGFLTKGQAEKLTGTEPNYEGVMLDTRATFQNGTSIPSPVAYVSIWGALTRDGENPIANVDIPQRTDLEKMNTVQALDLVGGLTEGHAGGFAAPDRDLLDYVDGHMENYAEGPEKEAKHAERLERTRKLQEGGHSLPALAYGQRVFMSTIARDPIAADFAPEIEYIRPEGGSNARVDLPEHHV